MSDSAGGNVLQIFQASADGGGAGCPEARPLPEGVDAVRGIGPPAACFARMCCRRPQGGLPGSLCNPCSAA